MNVAREPYGVLHADPSPIKDVYGGDAGFVFVECMRIRPADVESKTVIVFSHPIGGGSFLPLVNTLAADGCARHLLQSPLPRERHSADPGEVRPRSRRVYQGSRRNASATRKSCSADGPVAVRSPCSTRTKRSSPRFARRRRAILRIWSQRNSNRRTACFCLPRIISRSVTLTEWIDPSIRDEARPFDRDPELNLYDKTNPNQPAYDAAFLDTYRAAQIARNRRITARVKETLAALASGSRGGAGARFLRARYDGRPSIPRCRASTPQTATRGSAIWATRRS